MQKKLEVFGEIGEWRWSGTNKTAKLFRLFAKIDQATCSPTHNQNMFIVSCLAW